MKLWMLRHIAFPFAQLADGVIGVLSLGYAKVRLGLNTAVLVARERNKP